MIKTNEPVQTCN